jgi:hypothetical protein
MNVYKFSPHECNCNRGQLCLAYNWKLMQLNVCRICLVPESLHFQVPATLSLTSSSFLFFLQTFLFNVSTKFFYLCPVVLSWSCLLLHDFPFVYFLVFIFIFFIRSAIPYVDASFLGFLFCILVFLYSFALFKDSQTIKHLRKEMSLNL